MNNTYGKTNNNNNTILVDVLNEKKSPRPPTQNKVYVRK